MPQSTDPRCPCAVAAQALQKEAGGFGCAACCRSPLSECVALAEACRNCCHEQKKHKLMSVLTCRMGNKHLGGHEIVAVEVAMTASKMVAALVLLLTGEVWGGGRRMWEEDGGEWATANGPGSLIYARSLKDSFLEPHPACCWPSFNTPKIRKLSEIAGSFLRSSRRRDSEASWLHRRSPQPGFSQQALRCQADC